MFQLSVVYRQAIGKDSELQAALGERVKLQQGKGRSAALLSVLSEDPAFVTVFTFPDLAAVDTFAPEVQADPTFHLFQSKLPGLVRAVPEQRLSEIVIPLPQGGTPLRIVRRIVWYPALGKAPELRGLLETQVKALNAQGIATTLLAPLASEQGPLFVSADAYPSLAVFEEGRQKLAADATMQGFLRNVAPLLRQPASSAFATVVVAPSA